MDGKIHGLTDGNREIVLKKDCYMHLQLDRKTHRWIDRKTEKFDGSPQDRQMN